MATADSTRNAATPLYCGPTAADLARIPAVLKERRQWILWRGEDRINETTGEVKLNKIPIDPQSLHNLDPQTLRNADTTDPLTWGTFEQCVDALPTALEEWEHDNPAAYRGGGLGFVFSADDPFCGIDLDKCRDLDTGELEPWAKECIESLASYTEVTPSSTGLHTIVEGSLTALGRKKGHVETYDQRRFFTMTGWHLPGMPVTIEPRQAELTTFHAAIFGDRERSQYTSDASMISPPMDDATVLDKARTAKNGSKFTALWNGDTTGYVSHSEADAALCSLLAFWTQDAAQIDRLFRQCGLMRSKWDEQHGELTYGQDTIADALAWTTEHYSPRQKPSRLIVGLGTPAQQIPPCPDILLNTELTRMVDETQAALQVLPHAPVIYQRTRHLTVIARGTKPPKWLHRPQDMPVMLDASAARLTELASQAAHYWKWDKRAKKWELALPSTLIVETLCSRTAWPFPVLEGIIASPTLRPDGSVLDAPGYDADTGLYLDTNGTTFPPLLAHPTLDDARTAIGHLQEAVLDFPFSEEKGHFSATLAAMLSLVCRFTIMGNVPLFAIRANTRGSGKSLLADVISIIGTGCAAPRWPQVKEDEEERKRLLTVALAGYPCIHIDNVAKPLGSPALDMALTATSFSDRLLGKNESREAPLHMVWLASGNNMQFQGDTARRVVPIDLDPKMERPEERTGFAHTPLIPWLQQERPRLTVAALTIMKAYFEADRPSQDITPMGSFEQWSDLIRQALIWTGEADPNAGRKDLEAESDPEYERLAGLLEAWTTCYPIADGESRSKAITLKDVLADIAVLKATALPRGEDGKPNEPNKFDALQEALGALDQHYDGKVLRSETISYKLRAIQRRMIGTKRLVTMGKDRTNKTQWGIESL